MCIVNPKTNERAQIKKTGIISLHVFEQPSSSKGLSIHETMTAKPNKIAAIPEATWSQTIVDCKSDNSLLTGTLVKRVGIISETTVARLSARHNA